MNIKIVTTLLFVVPLLLAIFFKLYVAVVTLSLSMLSSLLFHLNQERFFKRVDIFCSTLLIASNSYLIYLSGFKYPYFQLAMAFVALAFYFWLKEDRRRYDFNHSMWHLASIGITLLCIAGYLL